jgi:hypothetical protein
MSDGGTPPHLTLHPVSSSEIFQAVRLVDPGKAEVLSFDLRMLGNDDGWVAIDTSDEFSELEIGDMDFDLWIVGTVS